MRPTYTVPSLRCARGCVFNVLACACGRPGGVCVQTWIVGKWMTAKDQRHAPPGTLFLPVLRSPY